MKNTLLTHYSNVKPSFSVVIIREPSLHFLYNMNMIIASGELFI